jgi:hypothetical protein
MMITERIVPDLRLFAKGYIISNYAKSLYQTHLG